MKMMNNRTLRIILIVAILLISAGCAYGVDRIANNHFNSYDANVYTNVAYQNDADIIGIYSCEVNEGVVTVTGPDPQFVVSANDMEISRVHIMFSTPVSQDIFLQIFFAPVGAGFSEENSVVRCIIVGSQDEVFQIPETAYSALRFDFEQNVNLDKIYVGKEEHINLENRIDVVRLIAVFGIIFIPMCGLILLERKTDKGDLL